MSEAGSWTDEELARQSQAGSLRAFDELVSRYESRVYAFALNFCRSDADARDVTQETFVRAFQALDRFDARAALAPWLFAIARRKSIDLLRAKSRRQGQTAEENFELDGNDPAVLLERREEAENLWVLARNCLPVTQYQALWLRYAQEMSVAQIAVALGKTRAHVKVMLLRARRVLARELDGAKNRGRCSLGAAIRRPAIAG